MTENLKHNNPSDPPEEELTFGREISGRNDLGLEDTDATVTERQVVGQGREEEDDEEVQLIDGIAWQVDPGQERTMQDQPSIGRTLQDSLVNLALSGQHFRRNNTDVQAEEQGLENVNNGHRPPQWERWQLLNQVLSQSIAISDPNNFAPSSD